MHNYNIPVRLAKLGKRQIDILREIKKNGLPGPYDSLYPTELSKFIHGDETSPKAETMLAEADKIITSWEAQK